jgi:hypothetical protein
VADKSTQMILAALGRAAASAAEPLFGTRAAPGLFPSTAAGKQAAQRCQDEGYLRLLSPEDLTNGAAEPSAATATLTRKKVSPYPLCAVTEKGLALLLNQVSPRQVLEDFVLALEARRRQADDLLALAGRMQQGLDALKANAEKVLRQTYTPEAGPPGGLKALFSSFLKETSTPPPANGAGSAAELHAGLLAELACWESSAASEDCPLSHLYRCAAAGAPGLTIGHFHDALRRLHEQGKVYLHPWTGPLYEIPEPPYALLVGHEIAYYASRRGNEPQMNTDQHR